MPAIKIDHCLVCDTIRQELGRKLSLLGFYGVTPNVEIRLEDPDLPIAELAFVLIGSTSGTAGQVRLQFEVFDSRGDSIFASPVQSSEVQPSERANFIFGVRLLKLRHVGHYEFQMRADGQPVYSTKFLITSGASPPHPNFPLAAS
jgi:hypothetical protein